MTVETGADTPPVHLNPSELTGRLPAAQKEWCIAAALACAPRNSIEHRVDAVGLLPADSEPAVALLDEVTAMPASDRRFHALNTMSRWTGRCAETAWWHVVDMATDPDNRVGTNGLRSTIPLENLLLGRTGRAEWAAPLRGNISLQCDSRGTAPTRRTALDNVVLALAARQEGMYGSDHVAAYWRQTISPQQYPTRYAEATLGVIEGLARRRIPPEVDQTAALARNDRLIEEELANLRHPAHVVRAQLKIAMHRADRQELWEQVDSGLSRHWEDYSTQARLDIIDDLVRAKQFDRAQQAALRLHPSSWDAPGYRYGLKLDTLVNLAHAQAVTSPNAARRWLAHTEQQAFDLLESGGAQYPDALASVANTALRHRLALTARQYPDHALRMLAETNWYGDDDSSDVRQMLAARVIAPALAEAGRVEQAVQLADGIIDDSADYDPIFATLRCDAFIDIARALHRREHGQAVGSAALQFNRDL